MGDIRIRPVDVADEQQVVHLRTFVGGAASIEGVDISSIQKAALLALVAVELTTGDVVGFLRLDELGDSGRQAWMEAEAALLGYHASRTAVVAQLAATKQHVAVATSALLQAAFTAIRTLDNILLLSGAAPTAEDADLASAFDVASVDKQRGLWLCHCGRSRLLPRLAVRVARVEDHDDMVPLLERGEQQYPSLARLPDSCTPGEPFALTRLISSQDDDNCVLVAEAGGRLVGFMVATSDLDVIVLHDSFDLHPYDGFLNPEVYEALHSAARDAVIARKQQALQLQRHALLQQQRLRAEAAAEQGEGEQEAAAAASAADGDATGSREAVPESGPMDPPESDAAPPAAAPGAEAGEGAADDGGGDEEEAPEATDEEVRAELLSLVTQQLGDTGSGHTLMAITMLCMEPAYHSQAVELLPLAFQLLKGDHCALSLRHDASEPPITQHMSLIPPLPGSTFPEVLHVLHRHSLLEDFHVRRSGCEAAAAAVSSIHATGPDTSAASARADLEGVAQLVAGMPTGGALRAAFEAAAAAGRAFVATCGGTVIGMCTVTPSVDVPLLHANFVLDGFVDGHSPLAPAPQTSSTAASLRQQQQQQQATAYLEVDVFCINPIFHHRAAAFMVSVLSAVSSTALFYALPPSQTAPDTLLQVMTQIPPRHVRGGNDARRADFALYAFNRRLGYSRRTPVNAQLVVVGASECGIAAVERLLLDPHLLFNCITLLAPDGIAVGGPACHYTPSIISRLGLEARVTLVDGRMVGLDRSSSTIELHDGSRLAYDYLLLTAGLQELTHKLAKRPSPELLARVVDPTQLAAGFSDSDAAAVNKVLVVGNTIGAQHALTVLQRKGVPSEAVVFVAPPGQEDPLVTIARALAAELSLELTAPEPADLTTFQWEVDSPAPACTLETDTGNGKVRQSIVEADLIVGCGPRGEDAALFGTLNDAGLVWDGRLVVDSSFRTNDARIFAAGPLAKFSRRYSIPPVHLEHHNSNEVGRQLGAAVVQSIRGQPPPPQLPPLANGKVAGCTLPGSGAVYLFIGCMDAMAAPSLNPPPGGYSLCTTTSDSCTRLLLDAGSRLHAVAHLERTPRADATKLSRLVGLPVSYLNNLPARVESGEVTDLAAELMGPWTDLLATDSFRQLRLSLIEGVREQLQAAVEGFGDGAAAAAARDGIIEAHKAELQMQILDAATGFVRARWAELPACQPLAVA